jgi:hypothetical protein
MRLGDFKVVDDVGIQIVMMPQSRRGQNFQKKMIHRLPLVRERLQARFVKTLPHGRGVVVLRAMNDFPFHAGDIELLNFRHIH